MLTQQTPEEVVDRYLKLKSDDSQFLNLAQEITDFVFPRKSEIIVRRGKGARRNSPLQYDGTSGSAAIRLANFISSSVTPSTSQWINFEHSLEELNEDEESREWLLKSTRKLQRRFAQSNFGMESLEAYTELVVIATGSMFMDAVSLPRTRVNPTGFGGFRFRCNQIGSYSMAENPWGVVDSLFREHEMTTRAAILQFGEKAVPAKYKKNKQDDAVHILHAVYPRVGVKNPPPRGTAAKKLPWASCWIDLDTKELIQESGFHEFPHGVVRWSKQSPEVWGRGQCEIALPDIRTLNEAVHKRLQAWDSAIRPPLTAIDKQVINRPSTKPNAVNYVKSHEALKVLDLGTRFDVLNFQEQQIRQAIRETLFVDQLALPDKSILTATEANRRILEANRILGPALMPLDYELLKPVVKRGFNLMARAGEFDPIPDLVLEAFAGDPSAIEVTFLGPLAKASKALELEDMMKALGSIAPLVGEGDPFGAMDLVDTDVFVQRVFEATGQMGLLRSEKKVKEIRKSKADAQAAQAKQQQMMQMMMAAGQAAPAAREEREAQAQKSAA